VCSDHGCAGSRPTGTESERFANSADVSIEIPHKFLNEKSYFVYIKTNTFSIKMGIKLFQITFKIAFNLFKL
jgi:hypothetical protein